MFLLAQNRLLREVLSRILSKKSGISVVACALPPTSMAEIMTAAPDVLVMDLFTTTPNHLQSVRDVRQKVPAARLVMIGMDLDGEHFLQAIREGALGYMLKDAAADEVVGAVRSVANGDAVCPPQLCALLFRFVATQNQLPNFRVRSSLGLTNREQQLVGLISQGLPIRRSRLSSNLQSRPGAITYIGYCGRSEQTIA